MSEGVYQAVDGRKGRVTRTSHGYHISWDDGTHTFIGEQRN